MDNVRETIRKIIQEVLNEGKFADDSYQNKVKEINNLIKIISKGLKNHQEKQKKDTNNWGFVGDLSTVVDELQEIATFLK